MSRRLVFAVAIVFVAACNRSPAPPPEKAIPDQVVPRYHAATPAASNTGSAANADLAMNPGRGTDGTSASTDTKRGARADLGSEPLSDAQIARITNNLNAAEIDQAKLARTKAKDAQVKAFAERIIKHHTEAKDKQARLRLMTAESTLSTRLEQDTGTTMDELQANGGPSFDLEYMTAQVDEHQRVLDTIDRDLAPNAKAADLQAYLKELRPAVEAQLKDAIDLEAKLMQRAAEMGQTRQWAEKSSHARP